MNRVGVVGVWHETNTYSSLPTTLEAFHDFELETGQEIAGRHRGTRTVIGGFFDTQGISPVPIFSGGAWPGGTVTDAAASRILEMVLSGLREAGPLEGMLVNLHGAMVAEGRPDMEAEVIDAIRSVVGDIPVVAVVDFHANPSVAFVDNTDVVIGYDTYPHVDMYERGVEAGEWLGRLLAGERVKTYIGKHPLLTAPLAQWTEAHPMETLVRRAHDAAERLGVERVCITGGFAYSDTGRAGISVLVTTGVDNSQAAYELIAVVMTDIEFVADDFTISLPGPAEAVASAIAAEKPVVLADIADNIGGGSPGDGTALLRELLAQDAEGGLCIIADAEVAAAAHQVGIGGTVTSDLGGKTDRFHGDPVEITGVVRGLSDGRYTSGGTWGTGQSYSMGPTALLRVGGVSLIVTSTPTPPFHVEQVTHLGIDPVEASIIIAKGAVAWRSAYGDIAKTVIEVDTPGVCPIDVSRLPRITTPVRHP